MTTATNHPVEERELRDLYRDAQILRAEALRHAMQTIGHALRTLFAGGRDARAAG